LRISCLPSSKVSHVELSGHSPLCLCFVRQFAHHANRDIGTVNIGIANLKRPSIAVKRDLVRDIGSVNIGIANLICADMNKAIHNR
jgi:hypothetical protein